MRLSICGEKNGSARRCGLLKPGEGGRMWGKKQQSIARSVYIRVPRESREGDAILKKQLRRRTRKIVERVYNRYFKSRPFSFDVY